MKLNLGCGTDIQPGWCNVDRVRLPGVDIVADLNTRDCLLEIPSDSVTEIYMSHILEHISNPLVLMEELWRVALPECICTIKVPHGAHDMAFADPEHVRQYFPASFQFFSQPAYKRADYGYRGDWECQTITITYEASLSDAPHERVYQLGMSMRNIFQEMEATLTAMKPRRDVSSPFNYNPEVLLELSS